MEQLLEQRSDWLIKMEFAPDWLRSQGTDPLELLRYLAGRYQIAEYPERIPYNTPDLASLFDQPVREAELEPFLEYVISLDRDGLGWVDLIVRPRAGRATGEQTPGTSHQVMRQWAPRLRWGTGTSLTTSVECVWPARAQLGECPCWDRRSEQALLGRHQRC